MQVDMQVGDATRSERKWLEAQLDMQRKTTADMESGMQLESQIESKRKGRRWTFTWETNVENALSGKCMVEMQENRNTTGSGIASPIR